MRAQAIERAEEKLEESFVALKGLEKSVSTYKLSRRHWATFLIASNGVFSALQQGAKSDNSSKNWMANHVRTRRQDELLSYVQHARNAYEHGLESITELATPKISMMSNGKLVAELQNFDGRKGIYKPQTPNVDLSTLTEMRIYPERATLIQVRDRGITYSPPQMHLQKLLSDASPANVAKLMYEYIARMLVESRAL